MRYYFGVPKLLETQDYTELYRWLIMNNHYGDIQPKLLEEYKLFLLESCRVYIDGLSDQEKESYDKLVKSAHNNLLIHRDKIENSFKEYINTLFSGKKLDQQTPPKNLSETITSIMLSELDMASILKHINLGTQEVDLKGIRDNVKLERINNVKRMHDKVLFFLNR